MLDHLINPDNLISVVERKLDRDENVITEFTIGTGYGVFRGQGLAEYISNGIGKFDSAGTLLFYVPNDVQTITIDGTVYSSTHTTPRIGDRCLWRDTYFDITGVDGRPNIYGDLVGYTIRCSNG